MPDPFNTPNFDLLDPEDVGMTNGARPGTTTDDMADWMGLKSSDSPPDFNADALADSDEDAAVADEVVDNRRVDESGKTKTPLWANPLMKLAFVAGVSGFCLVTVGLVVTTIQSAGRRDFASTPTQRQVEEEVPEDPMAAALQEREQQIGELKTSNALGTQQLAMEIQAEGGGEVSAAEMLALRNQLEQRRQLQQSAAAPAGDRPPATVSSPQSVTPSRPAPRPVPAPAPRPVSSPSPPASAAPRSAPRSARAEREIPPQEQLAMLSGYGSYGSGSALPGNTIAAAPIAAPTSIAEPQVEPTEAVPSFGGDVPESIAAVPSFEATPKQAELTLAEEAAAILGHTLVTVQSGTYAQAVLETPIYWAQDLADEDQSQRTALKLSEPLYGSRGEVALEAGTLLVAEVNVIAGSGLLQLYVTDVVVAKDGRQQVMSLPNQNLVIAGSEGQPLVAQEIQNTGEIRAAQVQLAALGALGNVGELLNRPESQTNVIGIGSSATSVTNGPVNILAGLLAGATNAVLPIEQDRVQDRIDDYESQPRIWYHGSDAPVMLFVAEEFTFQAD
jgi:hypothetical protein